MFNRSALKKSFLVAVALSAAVVSMFALTGNVGIPHNDDAIYIRLTTEFFNSGTIDQQWVFASFYNQAIISYPIYRLMSGSIIGLQSTTLIFACLSLMIFRILIHDLPNRAGHLMVALLAIQPIFFYNAMTFMTDIHGLFWQLLFFAIWYRSVNQKVCYVGPMPILLLPLIFLIGYGIRQSMLVVLVLPAIGVFTHRNRWRRCLNASIIVSSILGALIYGSWRFGGSSTAYSLDLPGLSDLVPKFAVILKILLSFIFLSFPAYIITRVVGAGRERTSSRERFGRVTASIMMVSGTGALIFGFEKSNLGNFFAPKGLSTQTIVKGIMPAINSQYLWFYASAISIMCWSITLFLSSTRSSTHEVRRVGFFKRWSFSNRSLTLSTLAYSMAGSNLVLLIVYHILADRIIFDRYLLPSVFFFLIGCSAKLTKGQRESVCDYSERLYISRSKKFAAVVAGLAVSGSVLAGVTQLRFDGSRWQFLEDSVGALQSSDQDLRFSNISGGYEWNELWREHGNLWYLMALENTTICYELEVNSDSITSVAADQQVMSRRLTPIPLIEDSLIMKLQRIEDRC